MIEVAVCEDSEIDRGMLEEIIGFLMTDRGLEYNMTPFSNGEGLSQVIKIILLILYFLMS